MGAFTLKKAFPGVQLIATQRFTEGIKELCNTSYEHIWPGMFPVGHTDNEFSSFLHVPSVRLVVSGDIIYGDCHPHFGEANTPAKRRERLDAIDRIEALNPHIVVAGHKRATQADAPYLIQSTGDYIHTIERELAQAASAEALFDWMVALHPHIWNHFILDFGCQQSFAERQKERL
ncbi:hypothetical protein B0J12DRAFT_693432 [Macrophomina phaseolina]|uniref:Beta-lactamase-like protein n=1 Tax=Macrophomina phaseolina TaxID=35725 RepID=A0ABQ8GUX4_9PEZI|nr:hypothetical protein B0J12DRAFT_693432 [Macrophomina phaseolina]